jgi:pimeloyl-ACP methyl ester carboxylesterase
MAEAGFFTLSINLSMNGTTPEQPGDFADLEAFGRQTYAQDIADIRTLLNSLSPWEAEADLQKIYLMGHSRGGAVALLAAAQEAGIKKVITLASVAESDFVWTASRVAELLAEGKSSVPNARTGQLMPLYEAGYREAQSGEYHLESAVKSLKIPILLLHGTADSSVLPEKAALLKQWATQAKLHYIEEANHTFGGTHPYTEAHLPPHTAAALALCLDFLREA